MQTTAERRNPVQRSVVVFAVLCGLAVGSVIIVFLALRAPTVAADNAILRPGARSAKPSVFGNNAQPPAAAVKMAPEQVVRSVRAALVRITSYDANDQPIADRNGFVYSADGMIVTSYEAVRGAQSIEVEAPSGEELHVISVMATSRERGLAVLAVAESNLPALEIDSAAPVQIDDRLSGGASVISRDAVNGIELIRTDTTVAPEQAGTPLLNAYGKVVAISTGGNAAVPVRYIPDLLNAIK